MLVFGSEVLCLYGRFSETVFLYLRASLVVQRLKHLPAMWETWVRSLGQEDPLEKEMATHSSILAWRIPWTEELGELQSTGRKESDTTERLYFLFHIKLLLSKIIILLILREDRRYIYLFQNKTVVKARL